MTDKKQLEALGQAIYDLGYRKIPEGYIVVKKSNHIDKSQLQEELTKNRLEFAKEILTEIGNTEPISTYFVPIKKYVWFKDICKKYGVEVEQ